MSAQPISDMRLCCGGEPEREIVGTTNSRLISADDEINLGEALGLPDELNGVIPGAVAVAD